jgi:hypothetical protein
MLSANVGWSARLASDLVRMLPLMKRDAMVKVLLQEVRLRQLE